MGHYPVDFDVKYPLRRLDRLTTLLRPIIILPIAIVLVAVTGAIAGSQLDLAGVALTAGGLLFGGPLLMIVFRRKYPRWWFDYNQELLVAYAFVLSTDRYPPFRLAP